MATFLGHKLAASFQDELGNDFHTRIEGTRIKHHMGPVAIKLYDQGLVEHRGGTREMKLAPMQKTIYSLAPLRELLLAANRRYLAFLSDLRGPSAGVSQVERLAAPVRQDDRTYRGFNLFGADDLSLFLALTRGEWHIGGFRNASLRRVLPRQSGLQISRLLKRLHTHGPIRMVGHTYKYYLTRAGQQVVLTALKLRELLVIPTLAAGWTSAHLAIDFIGKRLNAVVALARSTGARRQCFDHLTAVFARVQDVPAGVSAIT